MRERLARAPGEVGEAGRMGYLKANAGKLGLVGVLLATTAALHWSQGRGVPPRSDKIEFVCVASGKTFWLERGRPRILPAANPETDQRTLLPCYRSEDGSLRVSSRCATLFEQLERDAGGGLIDPDTLIVRAAP